MKKYRKELALKPPKSNRNENIENIEENNKLTLKIPRLKHINKSDIKENNHSFNKSINSIRSEIIVNSDLNKNPILEHRRNSAILDPKITFEKYNAKYNSNVINSRKMIENVFGTDTIIRNINDANYISISSFEDNDISKANENKEASYRSLISNDYNV
jgi:hypothetical protein